MMKQNWVVVSIVVLFLCVAGQVIYFKVYFPKIAYVNNNLLYKEFKGKAELEKKFIKEKESEQGYLDSLYMQLKVLDEQIKAKSNKDDKMTQLFVEKKRAFDKLTIDFNKRNTQLESKYLDQIWTQINQYTKDYGKEKGYDYILGAQGTGSLMYAVETKDITKDISDYCNKRYDGK